MPATKLLLFDIDGTLLSAGELAVAAYAAAFREVCGSAYSIREVDCAGRTDPWIVRELLLLKGHAPHTFAALLPQVFSRYESHLAAAVAGGARARLLDGVGETLAALAGRGDCRLALLTGNLAGGARLKLEAAGIAGYFATGAFGSDDPDRNRLGPLAHARARDAFGEAFPAQVVFVIGDSPHDIACAHAAGFRAVAVASGRHTAAELAGYAPELLVANLAEPAFLQLLG